MGGKSSSGLNRSQELADGNGNGWKRIMTYSVACPESTAAFLSRDTPPDRIDDSTVTSDIPPDDVSAFLERFKRGKADGPNQINKTSNRDYAKALGPVLATFYTRYLTCSVFPASFSEANIQCLKKSSALPCHLIIAQPLSSTATTCYLP